MDYPCYHCNKVPTLSKTLTGRGLPSCSNYSSCRWWKLWDEGNRKAIEELLLLRNDTNET